ncbi:MAG: redoxin domain-containing protein [Pyrinomonadaceae bacterium]|nr:redoxin domain-containing protein [Pyrinomonadaceae bacterium]
MKILFAIAFLTIGLVISTFGQHEYAPLKEKKIKYQDWTYKNVLTNEDINLRNFTKDKKLVMVFYFAPWCHSSNYQAPVTQKLYQKYKDQGFGVIGVSLYGTLEKVRETVNKRGIEFPVVTETFSKSDRKKSLHYNYRKKTGDNRKWGTPYNVFLIPDKLNKSGDLLTKKTFVVNGEIVEKEAEAFIRQRLGLSEHKFKAAID